MGCPSKENKDARLTSPAWGAIEIEITPIEIEKSDYPKVPKRNSKIETRKSKDWKIVQATLYGAHWDYLGYL